MWVLKLSLCYSKNKFSTNFLLISQSSRFLSFQCHHRFLIILDKSHFYCFLFIFPLRWPVRSLFCCFQPPSQNEIEKKFFFPWTKCNFPRTSAESAFHLHTNFPKRMDTLETIYFPFRSSKRRWEVHLLAHVRRFDFIYRFPTKDWLWEIDSTSVEIKEKKSSATLQPQTKWRYHPRK